MKEKGNPHPEKQPNKQKDQLSQRDLQHTEESTAAGLRTEKQSERSTDHLNCWHRHHSLRFTGRGWWTLRLRLWSSEKLLASPWWADLWVAGANHCNYPWLQRWCGLPQLGISEQKLLADPTISEGITEKDTTMEPHLMVLSLLWGHTHPAATTAKHSKRCPYAWSLSLPRNRQLRAPSSHILSGLSRTRCFLHDFTGDGANHQSYL